MYPNPVRVVIGFGRRIVLVRVGGRLGIGGLIIIRLGLLVAFLALDGSGLLSLLDLMDALVEAVAKLGLEVLLLLAALLILGLLRSLDLVWVGGD